MAIKRAAEAPEGQVKVACKECSACKGRQACKNPSFVDKKDVVRKRAKKAPAAEKAAPEVAAVAAGVACDVTADDLAEALLAGGERVHNLNVLCVEVVELAEKTLTETRACNDEHGNADKNAAAYATILASLEEAKRFVLEAQSENERLRRAAKGGALEEA